MFAKVNGKTVLWSLYLCLSALALVSSAYIHVQSLHQIHDWVQRYVYSPYLPSVFYQTFLCAIPHMLLLAGSWCLLCCICQRMELGSFQVTAMYALYIFRPSHASNCLLISAILNLAISARRIDTDGMQCLCLNKCSMYCSSATSFASSKSKHFVVMRFQHECLFQHLDLYVFDIFEISFCLKRNKMTNVCLFSPYSYNPILLL